MKPLYARPLTSEEQEKLEAGLKSASGWQVRRSQIILMSANERLKAEAIGQRIELSGQQVRRVLQAFNREGVKGLERSSRTRHDDQRAFDNDERDRLREIVRQSPRAFGYETSVWTLDLLADVSDVEGLTAHQVHRDTVSATLASMGITWQRAKHWINSPDPNYAVKKATRLAEDTGRAAR